MIVRARLVDVFLLGPFQIWVGLQIRRPLYRILMILIGTMNILYNGHNYWCLEQQQFCLPYIPYTEYGKYQIHRLYNLLLMYPFMWIISLQPELSITLRVLLRINVIIGWVYNFFFLLYYR